jgi:GT2 family glycosyltransferase
LAAPLISVIVLNYNGLRWLSLCLDALAAQVNAPPFEIVFVDNASMDGSAEWVRARDPKVRVLEAGANLGFAAGNNAGARIARGEWLAFLNNDTAAQPDWLARLYAAAIEHPAFAIVTSRIVLMDDPDVIDSAGDGYLLAGGAFKHGHGGPARDHETSGEVFGACGAAFLIKRAVFDELRGFDGSFFMVYEDVDLSYRARLRGHRVWYAADAIVRHAVSASLGLASATAVFHGQRNLEWTWIKNTPASLLWRTAPSHIVYSLAGVLHYLRVGRFGAALRGKLAALAAVPRMWRARREVQRTRLEQPQRLMERGWLALKRREKQAARALGDRAARTGR